MVARHQGSFLALSFETMIIKIIAVLKQKPDAHIVIAGSDRVAVKDKSDNKKNYKSLFLEKVQLDTDRVLLYYPLFIIG
jgi:hypothetical protein